MDHSPQMYIHTWMFKTCQFTGVKENFHLAKTLNLNHTVTAFINMILKLMLILKMVLRKMANFAMARKQP